MRHIVNVISHRLLYNSCCLCWCPTLHTPFHHGDIQLLPLGNRVYIHVVNTHWLIQYKAYSQNLAAGKRLSIACSFPLTLSKALINATLSWWHASFFSLSPTVARQPSINVWTNVVSEHWASSAIVLSPLWVCACTFNSHLLTNNKKCPD